MSRLWPWIVLWIVVLAIMWGCAIRYESVRLARCESAGGMYARVLRSQDGVCLKVDAVIDIK